MTNTLPIPPEGTFPYIVKAFEEHDQSCKSLPTIWFGRKGGVTCFSEVFTCNYCEVAFWFDGVYNFRDEPESDYFYCDCCVGHHAEVREREIAKDKTSD